MMPRFAKRLLIAMVMCTAVVFGVARLHTPLARASGCNSYYQYCDTLWLNPGQMYSLDGYTFPVNPQNDYGCQRTGDPDLCWQIHSQTNTTWYTTQVFTQAVAYDSCDGGYSWVDHSNQYSEAYGPGHLAYGPDAYGLYSDCGQNGDHVYALNVSHYETTKPDPNYYWYNYWYQF